MSAYAVSARGLAGRKVPQGVLTPMGDLLFSASEPGAWDDPSDMSTLWQDSAGAVPDTAVEQPVGLILDKRLGGLARSPLSLVGKTAGDGVVTVVGNVITVTGGTSSTDVSFSQSYSFTLLDLTFSAANGITVYAGGYPGMATAGRRTYTGAAGIYNLIRVPAGAPTTTITVHDAYNIIGNHASQATTTKRPVLSRRVNAQIYSEDFTNAAFRKVSVTVTANQAVAPDGTLTADLVEGLNSGESNINSYPTYYGSGRNEQRTISVYVKKGTASTVRLDLVGFSYATLNLDTGVVSGVVDATASAEALSDGWFRFSLSFMKTNEYHWAKLIIDGGVATAGSIYVWGWQEEHGLVATRYQRVNTPTDYDADPAKFPAYRSLDGVDDSHASATGGGGTAGFFFSAAVTPQGGAGTARTLFSDAGTNTGYIVRLNTSNQLELSAGNGTTYTTIATAGTLAVGSTDIVQAWDDGTNLNVKIGNGATASIARPTVSAGTAGYTMGQDNGASTGYFNGRIYSTIYRKDSGLTQVQRESVALYQRQKARMP